MDKADPKNYNLFKQKFLRVGRDILYELVFRGISDSLKIIQAISTTVVPPPDWLSRTDC